MNDSGLVSGDKGIGDLNPVMERLIERQLSAFEKGPERLPVQVLHDEEIRPVLLTDVVDGADMRV
jgi:hypothetical protein